MGIHGSFDSDGGFKMQERPVQTIKNLVLIASQHIFHMLSGDFCTSARMIFFDTMHEKL